MNLSAPTFIVFLVSVIIGIVGLADRYMGIGLPLESFHIMLVAWLVLLVGNVMKGL